MSACFPVAASRRRGQTALSPHAAWRFVLTALFLACAAVGLGAAEVIPPAPPRYFNDYAGVVPAAIRDDLNRQLEQFERDTSNQLVVAIYPTMQSDSSLEDYATRLYEAWHIGQKSRNNGALLLVFTQSHRMRIATGYGLEGVLPDALCARIMRDDIAPHLRTGDWAGGMRAGVTALMAAARGEYKGTGRTANDASSGSATTGGGVGLGFAFILLMIILSAFRRRRSVVYGRRGPVIVSSPWWGGGGWGGGGGSWGGGGGGGGFSGGGGSTGGGGASGSW